MYIREKRNLVKTQHFTTSSRWIIYPVQYKYRLNFSYKTQYANRMDTKLGIFLFRVVQIVTTKLE